MTDDPQDAAARLDAWGARLIEHMAAELLRHHAAGHRFDAEAAGQLLAWNADREARGLPAVALPAALVRLIAEHLQGRAGSKGRRVPFDGWPNGWLIRRAAAREFADRRAAGEKYDALIAEFADTLGVSATTVESIVSPKK